MPTFSFQGISIDIIEMSIRFPNIGIVSFYFYTYTSQMKTFLTIFLTDLRT